jgi:hypothetical protein
MTPVLHRLPTIVVAGAVATVVSSCVMGNGDFIEGATLRADARRQSVWVESEGSGARVALVLPEKYEVAFDPLVITDREGRVVAREGEAVNVSGVSPVETPAGCPADMARAVQVNSFPEQ